MGKNIEDLVSTEIANHNCNAAVADYAMVIDIVTVVILLVVSSIATACYHLGLGEVDFWAGVVTFGIIETAVIFVVSRCVQKTAS